MAAIDPSEEPEFESEADKLKPRATLKLVRVPEDMLDDEDDSDFDDDDEEDDEEESDDEEVNGGPSKKKSKSMDVEDEDDEMDSDDDDDAAAEALLKKIMKASKKGKSKALDDEEESDDDEDDIEGFGMDECVLCTLDPEKVCWSSSVHRISTDCCQQYQQPLDFVVAEGEKIFFKVSGTHTVHLTGNYVMPIDEPSDDDENEYDLSPDEDELDGLDALVDGDDSEDELDGLEDPRLVEVDTDEEMEDEKPKTSSTATAKGKGKNKRPAEDDVEDVSLDNIMAKSLKEEPTADSEKSKKMTKAEKKAAKKLKNNDGEATAAPEAKKETAGSNGTAPDSDKKKVQFAKNLEQGPTPSAKADAKTDQKADKKADKKENQKTETDSKGAAAATKSIRTVQGITIDERKTGTGPAAKKNSRLEMRYIGKLEDGKVFDANKSGKPFAFKLGIGEVIAGWDIGLIGITAGGERRLTIPADKAYGKKGSPPAIPPNAKLIFDIKCLSVK